MIKYFFIPTLKNYIPYTYYKLYLLKLNNTYYGLHKSDLIVEKSYGDSINTVEVVENSNTYLLSFVKKSHAVKFKERIEEANKEKETYNRIITNYKDNIYISNRTYLNSITPCYLEEKNEKDFEYLCILNYFNMFIVYDVEYSENSLDVIGYEYKVRDKPNRSLLEHTFNKMLD